MSDTVEAEALFAKACAGVPVPVPGSGARDALVRRVYRQVHCRLSGDRGGWSSREQAAECLSRARRELVLRPVRHRGFTGWFTAESGETVLRDGEGIEVLAPPGAPVEEEPDGIALAAPALALSQVGRWLVWSSPGGRTAADTVRVYLNARPRKAFDTWLAVVRALEESGLQSQAKVATSVPLCERADCVVAYTPRSELARLAAIVRAVVDERWLDDPVPGFAWPAGRGVGVGASDSDGSPHTSVGMTWSTRLVDALAAGPDRLRLEFDSLRAAIARTAADLAARPGGDRAPLNASVTG